MSDATVPNVLKAEAGCPDVLKADAGNSPGQPVHPYHPTQLESLWAEVQSLTATNARLAQRIVELEADGGIVMTEAELSLHRSLAEYRAALVTGWELEAAGNRFNATCLEYLPTVLNELVRQRQRHEADCCRIPKLLQATLGKCNCKAGG